MPKVFAIVVASLWLYAAAPASAGTVAPPGNSGIGQYLETVPTGGGSSPSSNGQGGGSTPSGKGHGGGAAGRSDQGGSPVPTGSTTSRSLTTLSHLGPDGRAAARLARQGLPGGPGTTNGRGTPRRGKPQPPPVVNPPSSESSAIAHALTGSGGGLGVLLPLFLVAVALGAGAIGVTRRRRA
jgi:hypothetical protein